MGRRLDSNAAKRVGGLRQKKEDASSKTGLRFFLTRLRLFPQCGQDVCSLNVRETTTFEKESFRGPPRDLFCFVEGRIRWSQDRDDVRVAVERVGERSRRDARATVQRQAAILNSVGVRDWLRRCRARTTESVLESHGPCESFELSIRPNRTGNDRVMRRYKSRPSVGGRLAQWAVANMRSNFAVVGLTERYPLFVDLLGVLLSSEGERDKWRPFWTKAAAKRAKSARFRFPSISLCALNARTLSLSL